MSFKLKIQEAVELGLSIAEIEAGLLGRDMSPEELSEYHSAKAAWKIAEAKRKAAKRESYRHESKAKIMRTRQEREAMIDAELDEARKHINWARRRRAESTPGLWLKTYGMGVFVDDAPPPYGVEVLDAMYRAVGDNSRPHQLIMARGEGKTSYTEGIGGEAISTGLRKYIFIISESGDAAKDILQDILRLFESEPYATDYPDISVPYRLKNGVSKRRQTYRGRDTQLSWNSRRIYLPVLVGPDGKTPVPTSGSVIQSVGIKGGIRGKKRGTLRPDMVFLDDLQTEEDAENPARVSKLLKLIRGGVMNLGGKRKLAVLATATIIEPDDLAEQLAADKAWKTTKYCAIITWPKDYESDPEGGLWAQYFDLFDDENAREVSHRGSLDFYRKHRKAMDEGAVVFNPKRFHRADGHISALQKFMDKLHEIGRAAFDAEYQNQPHRSESVVRVSVPLVLSRVRKGTKPGDTMPGTVYTVASTDINPGYCITTTILDFDVQRTTFLKAYRFQTVHIPDNLTDTLFDQAVFNALAKTSRELAAQGIHLDDWVIDAGGKQFKTVTRFCREPVAQEPGVTPMAMLGRAGQSWNPNVRSRVRAARDFTVLCKDAEGRRWIAWNADEYKEAVHVALNAEPGAPGGMTLFDGGKNHGKLAAQICNETLKRKVPIKSKNGADTFDRAWKSKDPHDVLDTLAQAFAAAANFGITGAENFRKGRKKVKIGSASSGHQEKTADPASSPSAPTAKAAPAAPAAAAPATTFSAKPKIKIGHA